MEPNLLMPQASALFQVRLDDLLNKLKRDVVEIKQKFNSRGLLFSTGTFTEINARLDLAIVDIGKSAVECAKSAHKASSYRFTTKLEPDLLDVFESNFAAGYLKLKTLRTSSTEQILNSLQNKEMHRHDGAESIAARVRMEGQIALREYFQEVKKSQKSRYSYLYDLARLILSFLRGH
ncbi:hypothetical protein [Methylobacter sp.]|uniref:hypothetical protein n=1 Tax=Methylobacter sp. TaxID=2051955 RepID=UPI003DA4E635